MSVKKDHICLHNPLLKYILWMWLISLCALCCVVTIPKKLTCEEIGKLANNIFILSILNDTNRETDVICIELQKHK